jgi:hypothetical protein
MTRSTQHIIASILAAAAVATLSLPSVAGATEPTKWVLSSHVGHDVNNTKLEAGAPQEERNQCTTASHDECQLGSEGSEPRGLSDDEGVAVSRQTGDVYIAEQDNHRVEVLDPNGRFLYMFGWKVNKTTGANTCSAEEIEHTHVSCGAGEAGSGLAGQLHDGNDVAVDNDPASATYGNVYVLDTGYSRVQEYTPAGEFVLMIGGEVNKKGGNICTKLEEGECQAGEEGSSNGAFTELGGGSNLITVGPEGLLYVGDRGRVQKFEADGTSAKPISLAELSSTGNVKGVAVAANGNIIVTDSAAAGAHVFSASGVLQSCVFDREGDEIEGPEGLAIDAYGRLGIVGYDWVKQEPANSHGVLYQVEGPECGKPIGGEIVPPSGHMGYGLYQGTFYPYAEPRGLAFSLNNENGDEDRLYVAGGGGFLKEVEIYDPVLFPEVRTCPTRMVVATSAVLCGEINPNSLASMGFFKYGNSPGKLEETTPMAFKGSGVIFEPMEYWLEGLVPNEVYWDEAYVEAQGERAGSPPPVSFHTTTPPPVIPGAPETVSVKEQSVVLKASVNAEHAPTRYHFEYAACSSEAEPFAECAQPQSTRDLESSQYGVVGATQEITGLAPARAYVFRLVADNRFEYQGTPEGGQAVGEEGHFRTAALPVLSASTGGASAVTATGAIVTGSVDPDGPAATYVFELGVYAGSATQYGIVVSGPVAATRQLVQEQLALSGLQPGTTYAFRIKVQSGYGEAVGAPVTFTTAGLPSVLVVPSVLAQLPMPQIAFPTEPAKVTSRKLTRGQQLALALKACAKKPERKRAACRRAAHKRYAIGSQARKSARYEKGAHRKSK